MKRFMTDTDVHLWFRSDQAENTDRAFEDHRLLAPDEIKRLEGFRFARDRQLFLMARAHLRRVLSFYAPVDPAAWRFTRTKFGRPSLAIEPYRGKLNFNVSHTYGLVAVAVSPIPEVGIDTERLDRSGNLRELSEDVLTPHESNTLTPLADPEYRERFLQLWTLKEAYAKARGLGLSIGFDRIGFDLEGDSVVAYGEDAQMKADLARGWCFTSLYPLQTHVASLAIRRAEGTTQIFWD